ncbi:nicotinate-nucleotide adenylyltransferase [Dialister pneumosintes]|jgi:nicotinate (nicotinamide) nucleotide adenylyltransferase|uniref:Probable nicotinate-nucleotide adenylyltransferase n=1 Tax=Dialister pneumosintes TaxID=39950 RepID=A0A1B3WD72_9FIRM|nr:nicotinate-nucleotide adenylyltransferase [Dialister pneumosintes]AOH38929.1 nicotinate (nicotinamide) nucleotide adenylyltransferase [Dialister pneumosintes]MBS6479923.1 nicotinate-nucleotide adenylyltransferase [Dialister sp.]RID94107.1 nicotinate-nucleotide adenylyltransferase [Dialister pneumosintes]
MSHKIGIFGGTFNPIHVGHLVIAEAAWQEFGLEEIIFIPTADTPKKNMHHVDKYLRYEMVKIAIQGNPHFTISPIEIERQGVSYTVDTIRELREQRDANTDFYFIAGTDAVADLPEWKFNKELLHACYFVCASRPEKVEKLAQTINYFGELGEKKILTLKTPELAISSTILREWIKKGISTRYFIPDNVIDFINEHKLYRR